MFNKRTGIFVQLGRQDAGRVQDLGPEVSQFGSFFEMQVADRRCLFNDARIVVVHTVDVCPYLDFFRTDSRTDQRGAVVAAATLQVVDLAVSIAADVALCDEEVCILVFVQ